MRSFVALSRCSWLEMTRDPLVTGLAMLFPMTFILMFLILPDLNLGNGIIVSALAFGLPAVLLFAILSLGLSGTAAPITQHRKDGVLRSVGMTPISRATFLLAQVPGRLAVVLCETILIVLLAWATGSLSLTSPLLLFWALALCFACSISLGLLLGSTSTNPGLVGAMGGIIPMIVLFTCGAFLPFRMFPDFVEYIGMALPYTYIADMLRHSLIGVPLDYPLALGSGVCTAWAAAMTLITIRVFRWNSK